MVNKHKLDLLHVRDSLRIEKIELAETKNANIELFIARLDEIHSLVSGNKFYKLKPHLEYAIKNNIKQLVSFGGAFSNHIHALALMADQFGFESVGIIRGEAEYANNPTLSVAQSAGMTLEFVSRKEYQLRHNQVYMTELQKRYPEALIIPEGGSSQLAVSACTEMANDINAIHNSDILAIASGTGASFAGLVCGLEIGQQAIAYSVLKDQSLATRIEGFIHEQTGLQSKSDYSIKQADYGGYAKFDKEHLDFILRCLEQTGVLLDPIYTSKLCRRVLEQINTGIFSTGTSITLIHTGGLQGWCGMREKVINLAGESSWSRIQAYIDKM